MSLAVVGLIPQYSVSGELPIGSVGAAMLQRVRFDGSFLAILFAFTFTGFALGGCSSGMNTLPPTLVSLQVTPANPSVAEGSQQQFTATGTFSDGSTQDLTKNVRWSSSDNSIVTIDSAGLATTHSLGRPQITASGDTGVGTAALVIGSTHLIIVAAAGTSTPRFAYVTNLSDDTLSIYSVNPATGQLRPHGYVLTGSHPDSICLHPSGKFAYITNSQTNDVSAFTVDPSGSFAYVTNTGSDNISAYAIDPSAGTLTPVPGSPFASGGVPVFLTVDPTGKFAYVANFGGDTIAAFSMAVDTGALVPITGSPFSA